jgi:hypothetical protein
VTDRDVMIAIFTAVTAIGERLTGERMTLHLTTESGDTFQISGGSRNVVWEPATAETEARRAQPLTHPATPPAFRV